MSALTLTPRALYEEVAELLRERIFSNQLAPGSWIDELKLAEEYGISRTPLREALKVLATEGLVTMKVRRGAYVTEDNAKDQRDVYHLLSLLESDAAGVVAASATEASGVVKSMTTSAAAKASAAETRPSPDMSGRSNRAAITRAGSASTMAVTARPMRPRAPAMAILVGADRAVSPGRNLPLASRARPRGQLSCATRVG